MNARARHLHTLRARKWCKDELRAIGMKLTDGTWSESAVKSPPGFALRIMWQSLQSLAMEFVDFAIGELARRALGEVASDE